MKGGLGESAEVDDVGIGDGKQREGRRRRGPSRVGKLVFESGDQWPGGRAEEGGGAEGADDGPPVPELVASGAVEDGANDLIRRIRALGERAAAELKQRWRTLQHVTLSPSRIGDITRAALVLNRIWK